MTDELFGSELDAFMDASAPVLGLDIKPEWRDAVRANLAVTLRLGRSILALDIPDEAEPAPVFRA